MRIGYEKTEYVDLHSIPKTETLKDLIEGAMKTL